MRMGGMPRNVKGGDKVMAANKQDCSTEDCRSRTDTCIVALPMHPILLLLTLPLAGR